MRRVKAKMRRGGPSEALKELGREMAAEQGIEPLQPGETRPPGYYMVDHFTGLSPVPAGAVVRRKTA